jgi:hypothetical protein
MNIAVRAPRVMCVEIGGTQIEVASDSAFFSRLIAQRYSNFLVAPRAGAARLNIEISPSLRADPDAELSVTREAGIWVMRRGDFCSTFDPATRSGTILQAEDHIYAIDGVLRIVHSIDLAAKGGFLLHASSVIREGRAFVFTGLSGAGKTTIARLAPSDATLLTDEVSYLRPDGAGYRAYGTPFAGDLGIAGQNVSAPLGSVFFLRQGLENRIDAIGPAEAARKLMRNILFFAHDPALVQKIFATAWCFVEAADLRVLTFRPEACVWELIG